MGLIVSQSCDTAKTGGHALPNVLGQAIHVIVMLVQARANKTGQLENGNFLS